MMKLTRPAIAAIVLLVVALLAIPTTAAAQSRAVARSVVQATTATWGAVAVAPGASGGTGALVISLPGWTSSGTQYFDVINVGTTPISAQDVEIISKDAWFGGGTRNPPLSLSSCDGGSWDRGRCTGTEASWGSTSSGSFKPGAILEPGGRARFQLTVDWAWTGLRSTINVSVPRAYVLNAPTTHNN